MSFITTIYVPYIHIYFHGYIQVISDLEICKAMFYHVIMFTHSLSPLSPSSYGGRSLNESSCPLYVIERQLP